MKNQWLYSGGYSSSFIIFHSEKSFDNSNNKRASLFLCHTFLSTGFKLFWSSHKFKKFINNKIKLMKLGQINTAQKCTTKHNSIFFLPRGNLSQRTGETEWKVPIFSRLHALVNVYVERAGVGAYSAMCYHDADLKLTKLTCCRRTNKFLVFLYWLMKKLVIIVAYFIDRVQTNSHDNNENYNNKYF